MEGMVTVESSFGQKYSTYLLFSVVDIGILMRRNMLK